MADDRFELRRINWGEVFSWTHIFKSFRLAIHPSKIALALAAVILVWLVANGLDWAWQRSDKYGYVDQAQIVDYGKPNAKPSPAFHNADAAKSLVYSAHDETIRDFHNTYAAKLSADPAAPTGDNATYSKKLEEKLKSPEGLAADSVKGEYGDLLDQARKEHRAQAEAIEDVIDDTEDSATDSELAAARQALAEVRGTFQAQYESVQGKGIWETFSEFEWSCFYVGIGQAAQGNLTRNLLDAPGEAGPPGFLACMVLCARGVLWLVNEHFVFALILGTASLAIWALFGGAIYRIAALHAAREEKISVRQALRFAIGKWGSFFTAPLIPLAFVLGLGLLIMITGVIGSLGDIGAIVMGMVMFLAILLGLVLAFIAIGLVGGFALMYPTIAVEGSDSFDAISRSFAYVFARPWRAALYSVVALVYGAICYLFVRLFAYIALSATHMFVRWGAWSGGESMGHTDKVPVLWTPPTFENLHGPLNTAAMNGWEYVGAVFIWIVTALVAAMVAAFLLSYISSSSTMIYYLLRRKVDATDIDDVYVQDTEEKAPESPAQPAAAPAAESASAAPDDAPKTTPEA